MQVALANRFHREKWTASLMLCRLDSCRQAILDVGLSSCTRIFVRVSSETTLGGQYLSSRRTVLAHSVHCFYKFAILLLDNSMVYVLVNSSLIYRLPMCVLLHDMMQSLCSLVVPFVGRITQSCSHSSRFHHAHFQRFSQGSYLSLCAKHPFGKFGRPA